MNQDQKSLSAKIAYYLGVVVIGVAFGLALQFVQAAFQEPGSMIPSVSLPGQGVPDNVEPPLNVGRTGQGKLGNLSVNMSGMYVNGLIVSAGNALVAGNVGVGTVNPASPSPKNNANSGNLDANDVYIRSLGKWISEFSSGGVGGGLGDIVWFGAAGTPLKYGATAGGSSGYFDMPTDIWAYACSYSKFEPNGKVYTKTMVNIGRDNQCQEASAYCKSGWVEGLAASCTFNTGSKANPLNPNPSNPCESFPGCAWIGNIKSTGTSTASGVYTTGSIFGANYMQGVGGFVGGGATPWK